jgi:hypothetical protein
LYGGILTALSLASIPFTGGLGFLLGGTFFAGKYLRLANDKNREDFYKEREVARQNKSNYLEKIFNLGHVDSSPANRFDGVLNRLYSKREKEINNYKSIERYLYDAPEFVKQNIKNVRIKKSFFGFPYYINLNLRHSC